MWVFGYGSLIWKADFPYERKLVGHIKGYVRRFYQKSTDHRGTPIRPGRVVTLLSSTNPQDEVWGLAYKIANENVDHVVNHLDFREKGGYERKTVLFYPASPPQAIDPSSLNTSFSSSSSLTKNPKIPVSPTPSEETPFQLTIYIGGEDNPNFAGSEDMDTIARHILVAHGPSGANIEYLYKLANAMRTVAPGVNDQHLFSLEARVRKLEEEKETEVLSTYRESCNCKD
ncbi:putative glutathione-specific gamma-glutamylcyclotransferase 2 [Diprion similis]|uniref:putative glutathione-specific gamma-glutamylcyclotransferase 2 n=1 Tax=Diprion similis TaxID=362088 RepID=UPI001EF8499D|nr:putative glutathione-specific gamma-glutamylcyclotransferase 2 [Diprion similis]